MDLPGRASGGRGSRGASGSAAAIAAGRAIVPDEGRTVYVAGVLANVGTTLLLATASTRRSATSRSGSARAGDRWTRPKRAG